MIVFDNYFIPSGKEMYPSWMQVEKYYNCDDFMESYFKRKKNTSSFKKSKNNKK